MGDESVEGERKSFVNGLNMRKSITWDVRGDIHRQIP